MDYNIIIFTIIIIININNNNTILHLIQYFITQIILLMIVYIFIFIHPCLIIILTMMISIISISIIFVDRNMIPVRTKLTPLLWFYVHTSSLHKAIGHWSHGWFFARVTEPASHFSVIITRSLPLWDTSMSLVLISLQYIFAKE